MLLERSINVLYNTLRDPILTNDHNRLHVVGLGA
jgi:hypothetical protein